MSDNPVDPIHQEPEADGLSETAPMVTPQPPTPSPQAKTSDALLDKGETKPDRLPVGILVVFLLALSGVIVFGICSQRFSEFGHPPPPPSPVPAQVRETRVAVANAVAPSLVYETGVITSITSVLELDLGLGHYVYFDGRRLWVNQGRTWLAIDPASREIVAGPISLRQEPQAIAFDGHQLWFLIPYIGLQSIDVDAGKPGSLIEVEPHFGPFAYDGERLWFVAQRPEASIHQEALQSVDLASRQVNPPIVDASGNYLWPCMVIADDPHEFLWIGYSNGSAQKYDLKQNKLLDTPVQRHDGCWNSTQIGSFPPWIYGDGGMWIYDGSIWRLFDTQTGIVKASTPGCERCIQHAVLGGGRLWVANPDLWTIQSFDAVTGQPDPPIPLSSEPGVLAFDGQRLWIMLFEPESGKFQGLQYIIPK